MKIEINIEQLTYDQLPPDEQQLVDEARRATGNSYAPYSHFNVGAAVRLADGTIVIGANQANDVFPLTLCAERTAIFAAQAQHPDQPITHLAVTAKNDKGFLPIPAAPCGSCRQSMAQVEQRYGTPMKVILAGRDAILRLDSASQLLPLCFSDGDMRL